MENTKYIILGVFFSKFMKLIGDPNSGPQKSIFKLSFFSLFQQKYVEVAINDFTMHLIILKWLRREKNADRRQKQ